MSNNKAEQSRGSGIQIWTATPWTFILQIQEWIRKLRRFSLDLGFCLSTSTFNRGVAAEII